MRIDLIRHGKTAGNLERRYIGRTDEPLAEEGVAELRKIAYPPCGILITSPMKRCIQTAEIIFPDAEPLIVDELRECDFGDFEGRNFTELSDDVRYGQWIDSGGEAPFPNGESPAGFRERCVRGFLNGIRSVPEGNSATFVVHGGTIMAILDRLAEPHRSYFEWQTDNGHGYTAEFDGEYITVTEKI